VPSPVNVPAGCRFHPRCPEVMEHCRHMAPPTVEVEPGHPVVCHLYGGTANRQDATEPPRAERGGD
jgi:ABC-type dipeptide/oligopeptide/nickel transport system ATPase component